MSCGFNQLQPDFMSEGHRLNRTGIRCALASLVVFGGLIEMRSAEALEWEPVERGEAEVEESRPKRQQSQPEEPDTTERIRQALSSPYQVTKQQQQGYFLNEYATKLAETLLHLS